MPATAAELRVPTYADLFHQGITLGGMVGRFDSMTPEERKHYASFLTTLMEVYASSGFIKPVSAAPLVAPPAAPPAASPVAEVSQPTKTEDTTWSVVASRKTDEVVSPKTSPKTPPKQAHPKKPLMFDTDGYKIKLAEDAVKIIQKMDIKNLTVAEIIANLVSSTDNSNVVDHERYQEQLMFQVCCTLKNNGGYKTVLRQFDFSNVKDIDELAKLVDPIIKVNPEYKAQFATEVINALIEQYLVYFTDDKKYRFMECTLNYIREICEENKIEFKQTNGPKFVAAIRAENKIGAFPLLDDIVSACFSKAFESDVFTTKSQLKFPRPHTLLSIDRVPEKWCSMNKNGYLEPSEMLYYYVVNGHLGNVLQALKTRSDVDKFTLEYLSVLYASADKEVPDSCMAFFYNRRTKDLGPHTKATDAHHKASSKKYPEVYELIFG
jgi:hypothetical protein